MVSEESVFVNQLFKAAGSCRGLVKKKKEKKKTGKKKERRINESAFIKRT